MTKKTDKLYATYKAAAIEKVKKSLIWLWMMEMSASKNFVYWSRLLKKTKKTWIHVMGYYKM